MLENPLIGAAFGVKPTIAKVAPKKTIKPPALPPAINYTPSPQWLAQMARMQQDFNGLLGGQQSFNLQPQRIAPLGGTFRAPAQNGEALAAQYLK